jgi:hypothetical protein
VTPHTIISALDAALRETGESVTLQHTSIDGSTGGITVSDEVTCPAQVRAHAPQDLAAGDVQDIRVIVSPTGLGVFGIPSKDDRVLIRGNPSNVEQIGPIYYGGQLVRVNLLCRG